MHIKHSHERICFWLQILTRFTAESELNVFVALMIRVRAELPVRPDS